MAAILRSFRALRPVAAGRAPQRARARRPVKTGLFIDADNVSARCAEQALRAAGGSHLCCVRAYKDWNREPQRSKMIEACERLGIEQIQVNRAAKKNSSDIKMCVDIVRLLHTTDMQRFILVTSDSDFRHVLLEIRNHGRVGCVYHGRAAGTSPRLRGFAGEYVMLGDPPGERAGDA